MLVMPEIPDLTSDVWSLVSQIPTGKVATYGGVANSLGDVAASRFVGKTLLHHVHGDGCRCHRVVRVDGSLGNHCEGPTEKARRLCSDGVPVARGRVDLATSGFQVFVSDRPLLKLANYQARLASDIEAMVAGHVEVPRFVGGVDLSYVPAKNLAVAAFVEMDLNSWEVSYKKLACRPVSFPYVSSYLAFRELPLLLELMGKVRQERELPHVVMVDGSGILHPRRAGIAAMLGAIVDVPTVGVTKKRLAGQVEIRGMQAGESREITLLGRLCGYALLPGSGTHKPLYISPGVGIDATSALTLVQRTLRGRRLPEPIYWADRLSRKRAKIMSSNR